MTRSAFPSVACCCNDAMRGEAKLSDADLEECKTR